MDISSHCNSPHAIVALVRSRALSLCGRLAGEGCVTARKTNVATQPHQAMAGFRAAESENGAVAIGYLTNRVHESGRAFRDGCLPLSLRLVSVPPPICSKTADARDSSSSGGCSKDDVARSIAASSRWRPTAR